jgi:putative transcription factor
VVCYKVVLIGDITLSPQKACEACDPKAVNVAIKVGAQVQSIKKFEGGRNKKTQPLLNTRKLDEETEPTSLQKVLAEVQHAI